MKSRIRGGDAAWAAVATTERLPVSLQATDLPGPVQPSLDDDERKKPPRVRKPSASHDLIHSPTADLEYHRARLRATFGTLSEEFADTMMGKIISGLRPNAHDILAEATLNAALATVASLKPASEIEALMAVQAVVAGFSALRMLELSQRHLGEVNIAVYGGYANRLLRLQSDVLQTLNRHRRGNSQSIVVKHVHIHPGAQGVVGIVNQEKGGQRGGDEN
ncbi:hypothetical protein SAMN03159423_5161 [Bradyrhizobium sp. NFR13]|uniref:hypothetical protein n=1 Tax=Bradyrhizobium sp. NFR13 TaxID=1566285 RepID=UPI0008E97E0C|nr:hypothetical protein [Bradyrhizobium sp. NFR13]SFM06115.1 hypothetical protein SAMN03159423_5161 [Bradyrhizobium sp. NFR13]